MVSSLKEQQISSGNEYYNNPLSQRQAPQKKPLLRLARRPDGQGNAQILLMRLNRMVTILQESFRIMYDLRRNYFALLEQCMKLGRLRRSHR